MGLFKKKSESKKTHEDAETIVEGFVEGVEDTTPSKPKEEWIWVDGFKGTNEDMSCNGYQYELNKCFDMPDGQEIEACHSGFHLCTKLKDVFKYYEIGHDHRFFAVKALVRKSDVDALGPQYEIDSWGYSRLCGHNDKLAAKSIIFTRELTVDEILDGFKLDEWTDEQKKLVLKIGYKGAVNTVNAIELVKLGYSEPFAKMIVDSGYFNLAYSVGSQSDLSMDMKAWIIFNANSRKR